MIKFLRAKYTQKYYNIGFAPFVNDINKFAKLEEVKWLQNNNPNKWYADPFIVDYNDWTITVFVEEMDFHVCRGTLTELVIDRQTMKIKESYEILNISTHLSFPAIYRSEKELYVYPENSKSGCSYIYKYDRDTHKLLEPQLIVSHPVVDAIFIDAKCDYMLATDGSNPNGNSLILFEKMNDNLYHHKCNYHMVSNIARNAGSPFLVGDKLIRPAQDCNNGYGKGVIFQIISQDMNGNVDFSVVDSLYPLDCKYNSGLHTFNVYKNLVVVDSYREPNKIISWLITQILDGFIYIKKRFSK